MSRFADVIIDISHERVDRPFTYCIPEKLKDRIKPEVRSYRDRHQSVMSGSLTGEVIVMTP